MHHENYEIRLNKKSNLFFHYTDKQNSFIKLHAGKSKTDDGFFSENKLLFTDFYIIVNGILFNRNKSSFIQLRSDCFIITFEKINIKIHGYLPLNKGNVYFYVENPDENKVIFVFTKKAIPVQSETFYNKEHYFTFEKSDSKKLLEQEIKNEIIQTQKAYREIENHLHFDTGLEDVNKALYWSQISALRLCTGTENQKGIWAGLPWFRENWGRDTFIALPGTLLVNGFFDDAKLVLSCFLKYQKKDKNSSDYGRIPNRYVNNDDVIYNTADGNLWFIKAVWQYLQYTGDVAFLNEVWDGIKLAVFSDLDLRTDKNGFLINKDSDTWMDARLEGRAPLSARGNRANEIQALWYESLTIFLKMSELKKSDERVQEIKETVLKIKEKFTENFWSEEKQLLADRLLENDEADFKIRPNQLFCITEDSSLLEKKIEKKLTKISFENLALPHGVVSLCPKDLDFHPYHIGSGKYHKDAAYHNGAIWLWLSGPMISSLCKYGWQNEAWKITTNHCDQMFNSGCAGTLSENANAALKNGKFVWSGTWSQAWSVSEFNRTLYQDYLGVRPELMEGKISFDPKLPHEWKSGSADIFAGSFVIKVMWSEEINNRRNFVFKIEKGNPDKLKLEYMGQSFDLRAGNHVSIAAQIFTDSEALEFASLNALRSYNSIKKMNYLFNKIRKEYKNVYIKEVSEDD